MIGLIVFILLFGFIFNYFYKAAYIRPDNFPPAYNNLGLASTRLAKEYKTKIVGLFLGPYPQIIVNDPIIIKEVLIREEFDGRMDTVVSPSRVYNILCYLRNILY
ncbi:unnamed protein product [Leptidea sinapis]|uniref:Uncharacterized protein n=1 Tax=Leptidea sinapis TaxID=189913 RepID=A0A5E4R3S0_9NEOP|nr:unnamed protein product [Leptidea sinapis]